MIRLPVVASLLLLSSGQIRAQDQVQDVVQDGSAPMVVTTDTNAYCRTLSDEIRSQGKLPHAVQELQTEGRALCDEGQVRGGINRLRRALMVLHSTRTLPMQNDDPPPS